MLEITLSACIVLGQVGLCNKILTIASDNTYRLAVSEDVVMAEIEAISGENGQRANDWELVRVLIEGKCLIRSPLTKESKLKF